MYPKMAKATIKKVVYPEPTVRLPEKRRQELLHEINMRGPCFFDCEAIDARLRSCTPGDYFYAEAYFLNQERIKRGISSIARV